MGFMSKVAANVGKAVPKGVIAGPVKTATPAAPSGGSGPIAKAVQAVQAAEAAKKAAPAMPIGKPLSNANIGDIGKAVSKSLPKFHFKKGGSPKAAAKKSNPNW